MKKYMAAFACASILAATAGVSTSSADEPRKWRFGERTFQAEQVQPVGMSSVATPKGAAGLCQNPLTPREMPPHECRTWVSLLFLRSAAQGGGDVPVLPIQFGQ